MAGDVVLINTTRHPTMIPKYPRAGETILTMPLIIA
jgi:hypothetical protein